MAVTLLTFATGTGAQILDQNVLDTVEGQVEGDVQDAVDESLDEAVQQQTDDAVTDGVEDAVEGTVGAGIEDSLNDTVEQRYISSFALVSAAALDCRGRAGSPIGPDIGEISGRGSSRTCFDWPRECRA